MKTLEKEKEMTEQTHIMGYRIEKQWSEERKSFDYILHGSRGARYGLVRNYHNKHLLFVINLDTTKHTMPKVRGHQWFTDINGILETAEVYR